MGFAGASKAAPGIRVRLLAGLLAISLIGLAPAPNDASQQDLRASSAIGPQVDARGQLLGESSLARAHGPTAFGSMSPAERAAAVDAYWGEGLPTAEKLRLFDKFWEYADAHYAAFQGIDVDWAAERRANRAEVAAGVSRGRFAAIMNHISLALRDSHSFAIDLPVNVDTVPDRGVPLLGQGGWIVDPSGACMTALDDGSVLVYSAMPNHPLGLEPGDRILGYDGRPWKSLLRQLLREELPLWPLWWGSSKSAFEHSFLMAAGMNWPLFTTMDIAKRGSGRVVHMPTSLMPGASFFGFCAEELDVPGVPKPSFFAGDFVSAGIVEGTHIGYVYAWAWDGDARDDFAAAVHQLTQVDKVDGLIIDLRFNTGGFVIAPLNGLAELFAHPQRTIAMDGRANDRNHFRLKQVVPPSTFVVDFAYDDEGTKTHVPSSYSGPVAVLVGPGALSAGDISAILATYLKRVRTFGKSTSMAVGLPTQPALGTELDLGPDWFARVAETNTFDVRSPRDYLTHDEFPVDDRVWLRPTDVAAGKDTVVEAAMRWLAHQ